MTLPDLKTERLILRAMTLADAPILHKLIGDRAIAATTIRIPHPYEDGMAEEWIHYCTKAAEEKAEFVFAICQKENNFFMGCMGLTIDSENRKAELGYWIGKPYWNQGYVTEAAREVIRFGFEILNLNRIEAPHFSYNPASGRVMQKIEMKYEGRERQSILKWGKFVDLDWYAILKENFFKK